MAKEAKKITRLRKEVAEQIAALAGTSWRTIYRWNSGCRVWREREINEALVTLNISINNETEN